MKAGVAEDIVYVAVYIYYFKFFAIFRKAFWCFQQNPEAGARNVLEVRKINDSSLCNRIHERLRLRALCGIQSAAANDLAIPAEVDLKHGFILILW
jgi:hypothetical protein